MNSDRYCWYTRNMLNSKLSSTLYCGILLLLVSSSSEVTLSGCRATFDQIQNQVKCLNFFTKTFEESDNLLEIVSETDNKFQIENVKVIEITGCDFIPMSVFSSISHLERLDMKNENVEKIEVNTFGGARNLKWLFLPSNKLRILKGESFKGAESLLKIDLKNNLIEEIDRNAFAGLTNLIKLDLYQNQIKRLDHVLKPLKSLQKLNVIGNQLEVLQKETFSQNPKLQEITVSMNKIRELGPGVFENQRELRILDLGENQLTALPEDVFSSLVNLEELHLGSNQLQMIPKKLLSNNLKLETLMLHENRINCVSIHTFYHLNNLNVLFLCGNTCVDKFYIEAKNEFREIENDLIGCCSTTR